jgi:hypothetical protein
VSLLSASAVAGGEVVPRSPADERRLGELAEGMRRKEEQLKLFGAAAKAGLPPPPPGGRGGGGGSPGKRGANPMKELGELSPGRGGVIEC